MYKSRTVWEQKEKKRVGLISFNDKGNFFPGQTTRMKQYVGRTLYDNRESQLFLPLGEKFWNSVTDRLRSVKTR